jgi:hypothetical protein
MVGQSRPYVPSDDIAGSCRRLALTPADRRRWRGHAGVMRRPWCPAAYLGRGGHPGRGHEARLAFYGGLMLAVAFDGVRDGVPLIRAFG